MAVNSDADRKLSEWTYALAGNLLSAGAILIGLLIEFGSAGPTSVQMEQAAPREFWSTGFTTVGVLGIAGHFVHQAWLLRGAHFVAAALCMGIASCFVLASGVDDASASQHGAGAYLTLAALHALVAVVSRPDR